jgi:hypothetical protein
MQRLPTDTGAAPDAANQHLREQSGADAAKQDDTTLSFDGLMKVTGDEHGGDPYNRTGSFKRLVR